MAVRTTGAEWNKFYSDISAWPKGAWHDDEEILVNGSPHDPDNDLGSIDPSASITVSGGTVYLLPEDNDGPALDLYFKRWRKAQTTVYIVCEAPRALAKTVADAILAAGGRVQAP